MLWVRIENFKKQTCLCACVCGKNIPSDFWIEISFLVGRYSTTKCIDNINNIGGLLGCEIAPHSATMEGGGLLLPLAQGALRWAHALMKGNRAGPACRSAQHLHPTLSPLSMRPATSSSADQVTLSKRSDWISTAFLGLTDFLFFKKKDFICLFLEGEGKEKEGEKDQMRLDAFRVVWS